MPNPLIKITFSTFALLALLTLSACRPGSGEGKPEAADGEAAALVPVEVATAAIKPMLASYTGTAALEPENQAQVVAKTSGVLLGILVEEGDQVRAGQLLARIDPERARLELARAEANLHRLENELRRSTDLFARKLVSSEAQDRARFDLDTQKAAYDIARLELDYTRIVAPISGVISERMVKVGNLIQLQQVMFRIDDFDPLLAVLNIPERELATIAAGLPAKMAVDALPGRVFDGRIARVSPVVEAGTGTFRATVAFRDTGATLKSGMFGRVSVIYDQRSNALVIPREALLETDNETAVFLLDAKPPAAAAPSTDKNAAKQPSWWQRWLAKMNPSTVKKPEVVAKPAGYARRVVVKLGYLSGTDAEVVAGIQAGDRVVTLGKNALREGAALQIVGGAAR
ncbi:MAG: efflux transporter periplasmic adaptor subunit [Lysobacterales bacterium CG02_land_8_20_14_3_00_62_12]|nr:MAG: efflux transporter periplasmic adaptor subunit [Xanthomonadales bacterium CG02_land_8_20_14_3_00_62_12]